MKKLMAGRSDRMMGDMQGMMKKMNDNKTTMGFDKMSAADQAKFKKDWMDQMKMQSERNMKFDEHDMKQKIKMGYMKMTKSQRDDYDKFDKKMKGDRKDNFDAMDKKMMEIKKSAKF